MKCLECGLRWEPLGGSGGQQIPTCPLCPFRAQLAATEEQLAAARRQLEVARTALAFANRTIAALAPPHVETSWCGVAKAHVAETDHRHDAIGNCWTPAPAGPAPTKFLVLFKRETDPWEVTTWATRAEAQEFFDRAGWQWNELYLVQILAGPCDVVGDLPRAPTVTPGPLVDSWMCPSCRAYTGHSADCPDRNIEADYRATVTPGDAPRQQCVCGSTEKHLAPSGVISCSVCLRPIPGAPTGAAPAKEKP
jgi:hypothetical protein